MKKNYIFLLNLLIITSLYSCGYKPIYSSKEFLFKINQITHENNKINNQIAKSLKSMSNNSSDNILNIALSSKKEKIVISKNKNGDPEIFELKISINTKINDNEKAFIGKQVFNNSENKFELNEYEIQLEKQIITKIVDEIIIFLLEFR
jgi:hypothetical protein